MGINKLWMLVEEPEIKRAFARWCHRKDYMHTFTKHKQNTLVELEIELERYMKMSLTYRQWVIIDEMADVLSHKFIRDSEKYNCSLFDKSSPYTMTKLRRSGEEEHNFMAPMSVRYYRVHINHVIKTIMEIINSVESELDAIIGEVE